MEFSIRDATPDDAAFIAWTQVEASRSGTPLGFWDVALPGPDEPRLGLIAQIATAPRRSFAHYSGFVIAEYDGEAVGALSGYDPKQKKLGHFAGALNGTLERNGWSEAHLRLLSLRTTPCALAMSDTPDDRWVVEWVAVKPEARGKGVAARLLDVILERGRAEGHRKAQISVLLGNTPAQRSYERAGFSVVDEKRHPDFEAIVGRPGTARMWRDL
jgi:ribosomal protein S18 acetylase RimI-like enzyme